ncbi:MAG: hypothetical protein IKW87_09490 [Ruminococcus sp.]|nr:hypothetical protein [Ruminococcus sp.]
MKDYYAQCYTDGMKMAGYGTSDYVMKMFYSYYSECENNKEYRALIQENGKDFQKFCAAYAQLKTNLTIGCSNDAPYDITSFLHLSKDEFYSFAEILPPRLANFAKGAFYLFHKS